MLWFETMNTSAHEFIVALFSSSELRRLANELGIEGEMPGDTASRSRHVDALLLLLRMHQGSIDEFVESVRRERPKLDINAFRRALDVEVGRGPLARSKYFSRGQRRVQLGLGVVGMVTVASWYIATNSVPLANESLLAGPRIIHSQRSREICESPWVMDLLLAIKRCKSTPYANHMTCNLSKTPSTNEEIQRLITLSGGFSLHFPRRQPRGLGQETVWPKPSNISYVSRQIEKNLTALLEAEQILLVWPFGTGNPNNNAALWERRIVATQDIIVHVAGKIDKSLALQVSKKIVPVVLPEISGSAFGVYGRTFLLRRSLVWDVETEHELTRRLNNIEGEANPRLLAWVEAFVRSAVFVVPIRCQQI